MNHGYKILPKKITKRKRTAQCGPLLFHTNKAYPMGQACSQKIISSCARSSDYLLYSLSYKRTGRMSGTRHNHQS